MTTLVEVLRTKSVECGGKTAFTSLADDDTADRTVTFAELDRMARGIAVNLQQADAFGERVLLLYPPGIEFVSAFLGCLYAGAVAVPSHPPHPSRADRSAGVRLATILTNASPALTLTTLALEPRVRTILDELGSRARCLVPAAGTAQTAADWSPPEIGLETVAFQQYTSGTTGAPKGVPITHKNLLHNLQLMDTAIGITEEDRGVNWLPPYHDMGLIGGLLQPVFQGTSVVLLSPVSFLHRPFRWLEAMSRFRATVSGGPGFAYDLCARRITPEQKARLDLSHWRVALNGAEPIHPATLEAFEAAFAPCGFSARAWSPCYGLAEATLFVSGGSRGDKPLTRFFDSRALECDRAIPTGPNEASARALASSGAPADGLRVEIVHPEAHTLCPSGTVGEIWLQGTSIAHGYWDNAALSDDHFRARPVGSADVSFFRTGDLGFLDQGELFVTGRLEDRIVIDGRTLYPQDIESTIEASHPALRRGGTVAFGVETDGTTALVVLCEVERQSLGKLDPSAVIEAIRQQTLQDYRLMPQSIGLLRPGAVPKTSSGKPQRRACRSLYLSNTLEMIPLPTS